MSREPCRAARPRGVRSFLTMWATLAAVASTGASAQVQNPVLAEIAENVALDLGVYSCPEGANCDPTNASYSGMVYDRDRHLMLLFGGGHAATYRDDVDVFDFATLTWAPAYAPTPCEELTLANVDVDHAMWMSSRHPIARHTYDLLVMAGQPSELWMLSKVQGRGRGCHNLPPVTQDGTSPYVIAQGTFAAYNPETRQWRFTETRSTEFETGAETDPLSGRILLVNRHAGICTIDTLDGALTCHAQMDERDLRTGNGVSLVYFPPNDRFYAFAMTYTPQGVWEVHFDRDDPSASSIRRLVEVTPPSAPVTEAWAYDDANQLIGGGVKDGRFFAFDPLEGRWHERIIESSNPDQAVGTVDGKALAYDPIDNVYIFRTNNASRRHTWAYRWGGDAPVIEPRPDAGPLPDSGPRDGDTSGGGGSEDGGEGVVDAADGGPDAGPWPDSGPWDGGTSGGGGSEDGGEGVVDAADGGPGDGEVPADGGPVVDGDGASGCSCGSVPSMSGPASVAMALMWFWRRRRR